MRPLVAMLEDKPPLTPADFIGTGCTSLTSFVYAPEDKGTLGFRFQQLERIRKEVWESYRREYVLWLRRQGAAGSPALPEVDDLVLVKDVPSWKGDGWPVARIVSIKGDREEPRVYELEVVPTEELKKTPRLINNSKRLQLKKKTILRNYRQLGLLPKVHQSGCHFRNRTGSF